MRRRDWNGLGKVCGVWRGTVLVDRPGKLSVKDCPPSRRM